MFIENRLGELNTGIIFIRKDCHPYALPSLGFVNTQQDNCVGATLKSLQPFDFFLHVSNLLVVSGLLCSRVLEPVSRVRLALL